MCVSIQTRINNNNKIHIKSMMLYDTSSCVNELLELVAYICSLFIIMNDGNLTLTKNYYLYDMNRASLFTQEKFLT